MKWLLVWLCMLPLSAQGGPAYPHDPGQPCADCHARQQREFQQSRMAVAAHTATFLDEWRQQGEPATCLDCHAPTGAAGVACTDCHGTAEHPYARVSVPAVCARCHDAPGEITLRSYRNGPAARRGEACPDCHLPEAGSHDFRGPARPGFLRGIATLGVSIRRDIGGDTALLRIRHRAGHALPGGTTGRAVWLLVDQHDASGGVVAERQYRFGWLHSPTTGWRENSLPPGIGKVVEVPLHTAARQIRVKLIYRFRAGALELVDPEQVVLVEQARSVSSGLEWAQ